MDLSSYAQKLKAAAVANNKAAIEEVCFDLECAQLEHEHWQQKVFDFFTGALKDKTICAANGSGCLVMTLYNDFDKLTKAQTATLLALFDENADEFGDEMLRHSVSDMIARKYEPVVAMKLFSDWKQRSSQNRLHMAQVGFEVLIMARKLDNKLMGMARTYLQELWQRKGP